MDPDPATSSVWTGCFGPSRASPHAGEGKHARSNSKTSLSLSRWWNTSTPQTDNTEALDGDAALFAEQDSMLAQLANDLLGLEGPAPKATAPPAAPAHERKLSWPFSSRKVLPESKPDVGRAADDASVDLHSLDSGEMGGSPSSTAGEAHAHAHAHAQHADAVEGEEQAEGAAPESAEASPARPQGYRRLWQSITSMRKGDRIASPNAAVQTQEYTIESLSRSVLSLKASQTVMEATKLASGLHALDSRAVAALLKELAKAGAPNRASELFDYLRSLPETDELSSLADLYTYTTVIAQCGSHQHLRRALELVAEMRSRGIQCNIHTYSALMSVCVKCNECELAMDVYEQLQSEGCTPNMVTYNILIDVYSRTGQWSNAVGILDAVAQQGLTPEARTYNAIISACGKAGHPATALNVYERMIADGVEPTGTTYTSIISALGRAGQVDEAIRVYKEMGVRRCAPNVITFSSLISVCERAGRAELALQLLDDMQTAGVRPNIVTYNGLVAACAQSGQWQRAAELVESMSANGCRPDAATYSALIAAYERAGQWRQAITAFEKAQATGIRSDLATYNCVLGALWATGRLPAQCKAIRLLAFAQRQGALRLQTLSAAEASSTAHTVGAATLLTLKWLANFRDGLTTVAALAANGTLRTLTLLPAKHAPPGHSYDSVQKALNSMFAAFSVPATAVIVPQGLMVKAESRLLPAWAASASGLALLSIFDYASSVVVLPAAALIKEDRSVGAQCAKAFAAVQEFERGRNTGLDYDALCSGAAAALRQDLIACITALSSGLQLREDTTHDAVQLGDRLLALAPATTLPPAPACAAALILLACRQAGCSAAVLRHGQLVLQAAGLPLSAVLEAEQRVTVTLGPSPAAISPLRVLHLFLERMGCDAGTIPKCQLVQVMVLTASDMVAKAAISCAFARFDPSVVAASCLLKARENMGLLPAWPLVLRDMTGFDAESHAELLQCLELFKLLRVCT